MPPPLTRPPDGNTTPDHDAAAGERPAGVRVTRIACPVCGGATFEGLFEKAGQAFVRCDGCTLVLINPPPAADATTATYDADYSRAYIRKADKKLRRCRRWVARVARRHRAGGRWLDVGCSAGFIVKAAEEAGYEAYGVELEEAAVRFAREDLHLANVRSGTLDAQAYPTGSFDVVSLYDVIEHVPDLNALVAELYRILAPSGIVEIRTPDVGHWQTPRDLRGWKEIKPSEHLYYFAYPTLTALFRKHGFDVAERRFMLKPALDVYFRKRRT